MGIALDDFGTGYSSLYRLRNFKMIPAPYLVMKFGDGSHVQVAEIFVKLLSRPDHENSAALSNYTDSWGAKIS